MFKTQITKEEINKLPIKQFEGETILIDSIDFNQLNEIARILRDAGIVGFDTETRPSFKKGQNNKVALLQLATEDMAFLFRLHFTQLPGQILDILKDESIIKTGVAIRDDIKALQKIQHFKPGGFIEIQEYVKRLNFKNFGLQHLAGMVLGFKISKRQRLTNWEAEKLTGPQIRYAATDAWVSCEIYAELEKWRKNGGGTSPQ